MSGPGQKNEFARKAKKMKFPLQTDNKDYGKKTRLVARNIDNVDTKTGQNYGTRTIMTKEHTMTFIDHLIAESDADDITTLPDKVVSELKGLIRKGAADLEQKWANALELVHKAYHVGNVRRPNPVQKGAWKQYEDLITYGVRQLSASRGINGEWRASDVMFREATEQPIQNIGKRRFFVRVPGLAAIEADAKTMDDIIEQITNKMRRHGAKIRVEQRSPEGVVLSVWVDDVKREKIVVQEIS